MQILFDRLSHQVVGVNRPALPFEYSLELEGNPILSKTLSRVIGVEQKVNEEGQPLFYFNGEEVTFPEHVIEAVYEDVTREEDVDGDGDLETIQDKELVSPEEVIVLDPVMIDKVEYYTVTFEDQPFAFNYEEVSNAKLDLPLETQLRKENFELKMAMASMYEESVTGQFELQMMMAEMYETLLG